MKTFRIVLSSFHAVCNKPDNIEHCSPFVAVRRKLGEAKLIQSIKVEARPHRAAFTLDQASFYRVEAAQWYRVM